MEIEKNEVEKDVDNYWKRCARFPDLMFCGCTIPCSIAVCEAKFQKVIDGLFIGPLQAAFLISELQKNNITHVVDLYNDKYFKHHNYFEYFSVKVEDTPDTDIRSHFDRVISFIDKGRKKGGVLVHCQAGISRSASFVIAYLMKEEKMKLKDALQLVKSVRPIVSPNKGFLAQLSDFELEIDYRS